MAKETGYSTTAVTKVIEELKGYNIIVIEEGTVVKNIKANINARGYTEHKLLFNLYKIKRILVAENINSYMNNPECIVLFGSFAKGEDIEESDIDVLIITSQTIPKELGLLKIKWEKEFNRKINFHALKSLDNSAREFKNAVANGIVLHGYLKVI
ncbi:nucleotidyltransferase domain-containing protein [Candidatus Woesearchaeota archaeon]|nr:nucleotidyltransferase domain-containing protein [Candidatus Woesearchaeota archaeon]